MDSLQTKLINTYKKISGFVFHYLLFLVCIVIAIIIAMRVISQASTMHVFQPNDMLVVQKNKLIAEFTKSLAQNTQNHDIQIQIMQGDFETNSGFIKSANNLIVYKDFVIPRYFYMYSTIPVKPLSYFSGGEYDTIELENFINNFVFTKKFSVSPPIINSQLAVSQSLVDEFNLSCLFENKISANTCDYYLNNFLDSFFVYTINKDYLGFKKIFYAITSITTQKERVCEGLYKYSLYANDQSDSIRELFGVCNKTYEEQFNRKNLFVQIQKTLENQVFEQSSYKDPLLNIYKLLSYQQQIYQDFVINKFDAYKITIYLDFVKELLKKNAIDQFYMDEIYRYNNNYLGLTLEKIAYQSDNFSQNQGSTKATPLLAGIFTINTGEPILGYKGLTNTISNKSLIIQTEAITGTNLVGQEETIKRKIESLSYITVEKQDITETTIDMIASLKFFLSKDKSESIKSHIIMEYKNDMLLIKSIELQNKPEMNDVIKNLLLIQNFSIGELYSYISKNLVFYEQTDTQINDATMLCVGLESLNDSKLISCSPTSALVDKDSIRYEFTFKDGGLQNFTISEKKLENYIKASYSEIIKNTFVLLDTVKTILAYTIPTQGGREGTINAIIVFEKIQQYLGIKVNDIADKNGRVLVDISLGGINFLVNYSLTGHTLGPWFFKDIRTNNKPYPIKNLNLPLDDEHQNDINAFVLDPLNTIKKIDITAWQNYQQFIKSKK